METHYAKWRYGWIVDIFDLSSQNLLDEEIELDKKCYVEKRILVPELACREILSSKLQCGIRDCS